MGDPGPGEGEAGGRGQGDDEGAADCCEGRCREHGDTSFHVLKSRCDERIPHESGLLISGPIPGSRGAWRPGQSQAESPRRKDICVREGSIYVLVNVNTGTCLDENQGNHWVRAWGPNGGDNQKWEVNRDGPGQKWWLRNIGSGRYLCPELTARGGALRTEEEPFRWHISSDEQGTRLQVEHDVDLHVDVEDASSDDDTAVLSWKHRGNNQVWRFEEV
ncbi:RICIN domain-containing protein [Nonomuraea sp. NPDC048882]|uniref:RICIN domain-containing protein n=1 Tax=Nonomuraea sp. NPDC048882 TaxID=3154347 RepID=UPI0033F1BDD9